MIHLVCMYYLHNTLNRIIIYIYTHTTPFKFVKIGKIGLLILEKINFCAISIRLFELSYLSNI